MLGTDMTKPILPKFKKRKKSKAEKAEQALYSEKCKLYAIRQIIRRKENEKG